MKRLYKQLIALSLFAFMISAAYAIPKGATPIAQLDAAKYMGKWYEIARLDFFFERGLTNTSAEYTLNDNGTIKVLNKGYNPKKQKWKQAEGIAKFREKTQNGALKVAFWRPFYAEYNIIALDTDYRYALVVGKNKKYMWILSRDTTIPEEIKVQYLKIAESVGIDTKQLVWVTHDKHSAS